MGCYHPIIMYWKKGKYTANGKKVLTFKSPGLRKNKWGELVTDPDYEKIEVSCGQCIGCRLDYSRQWAIRIQKEAELWPESWFLTLTYDTEHLPWVDTVNTETGELILGNPLFPKHLTKFLKDLRRYWEYHYNHQNIRFFACGEYGEEYGRPHYHICLMNFPVLPETLEFYKNNELGDTIYKCAEIEKIWGKGFITLGALTWQSAAYVARYIVKKQKGPESEASYRSRGQIPEFTRMSRKPGIGREWYELHKEEIYKNDELFVPKRSGAIKLKPAKYFDRLYDIECPERMEMIKQQRKKRGIEAKRLKIAKTTDSFEELLAKAERKHIERSKMLIRALE